MSTIAPKDRREYYKAWRRKNPTVAAERHKRLTKQRKCRRCRSATYLSVTYCRKCLFKRAAYRNLGDAKRWKELVALWIAQNGRCAYTHEKLTLGVNASIEHVVAQSSYPKEVIDNICWVRTDVNLSKQTKSIIEYIELCKQVLEGFGYTVLRYVDKISQEKG